MARLSHIRGMLLEEVLLYLLQRSGYRTVETVGNDPTLTGHAAGLGIAVRGRGMNHQIDAIADFLIHPPFTHPQRLLVEAKCYSDDSPVGISLMRESVGIVKDANEFWATRPGNDIPKRRFHYQYAVFSASGFTADAQRYAFAQDIYLIRLGASGYFQGIIAAIRAVRSPAVDGRSNIAIDLPALRRAVREALSDHLAARIDFTDDFEMLKGLPEVIAACQAIRYSLMAVLSGRFPILLTPPPGLPPDQLESQYAVRVYFDDNG